MRAVPVAFVAVIIGSILPYAAQAAIYLDALILALPLDEGDGDVAFDVSGRENDGKLLICRGGEPFNEWGPSKFGSAVKFEVPNNEAFYLSKTDFTFALWFVLTKVSNPTALMNHTNNRGAESTGWLWSYVGGRFVFHVITAGEKTGWTRSGFFEDPELNRWYHIAMTRVGSCIRFIWTASRCVR